MTTEIKDVNAKIDDAEAAVKKYASKDTIISIGGYEFTPAKLMVAATLVSTILGGLYGAFEVYKDYQSMKKRIAEYVAPDLSDLIKKMELTEQNAEKSVQYTQDIKNDLKQDIRRLETVVESVERGVKQDNRELGREVREVRANVERDAKEIKRDVDANMKEIKRDVDAKIKRALDNPLAN